MLRRTTYTLGLKEHFGLFFVDACPVTVTKLEASQSASLQANLPSWTNFPGDLLANKANRNIQ